jgi:hypothetical protein
LVCSMHVGSFLLRQLLILHSALLTFSMPPVLLDLVLLILSSLGSLVHFRRVTSSGWLSSLVTSDSFGTLASFSTSSVCHTVDTLVSCETCDSLDDTPDSDAFYILGTRSCVPSSSIALVRYAWSFSGCIVLVPILPDVPVDYIASAPSFPQVL